MAIWARSLPSLEDIPTQGMFEDDFGFDLKETNKFPAIQWVMGCPLYCKCT